MIFRRGFGKIEDRKRDTHTILFEGLLLQRTDLYNMILRI